MIEELEREKNGVKESEECERNCCGRRDEN